MTTTTFSIFGFSTSSVKCDISAFITQVLTLKDINEGHIDFNFVSKKEIVTVNTAHLKHDYVTDAITYNYGSPDDIDGDIYICTEKVRENAKEFNHSFEDELKLVLVHCILHLLDYKDYTDEEKKTMMSEQDRLLSLISNETPN